MKYNTAYKQEMSLKETIIETDKFISLFDKYYKDKYKLIDVLSPSFLSEESDMLIEMPEKTRPITFDNMNSFKTMQMLLTNSNWMRSLFSKIDIENNQGFISKSSYIWRDLDETPVLSPSKFEITVQIKNELTDNEKPNFLNELTDDLYKLIYEFTKDLSKRHKNINAIPQNIIKVTPQQMENEMPNSTRREREDEMGDELHAYIFANPGLKMYSGHYHTHLPQEIYNMNLFNQLIIKNRSNSSILKVASVAELAMGQKLSDQLDFYNKGSLKQTEYYSEQIKKTYNIFEIKINIGRLMQSILNKGHVSEVQPSVETNEKQRISSKYKIETY